MYNAKPLTFDAANAIYVHKDLSSLQAKTSDAIEATTFANALQHSKARSALYHVPKRSHLRLLTLWTTALLKDSHFTVALKSSS